MRRQKRLEGEDDFAEPAGSESDDGGHVKEKPKSATVTRGRGSRGGRGRGSRGGTSGRGSRGGSRERGSSSSTRGGRGSRGRKGGDSVSSTATITTPAGAASASPGLSFSSSGAAKSSRPMVNLYS